MPTATGVGTYVAMEALDRTDEFFLIVPGSGTGELTGITGSGRIAIDDAGERMEFDDSLTP